LKALFTHDRAKALLWPFQWHKEFPESFRQKEKAIGDRKAITPFALHSQSANVRHLTSGYFVGEAVEAPKALLTILTFALRATRLIDEPCRDGERLIMEAM
jgi:hypothetical protein